MKEVLVGLVAMAIVVIPAVLFAKRQGMQTDDAVMTVWGIAAVMVMAGTVAWIIGTVILAVSGG